MKAHILSLEGKKLSDIELPQQFSSEVDDALIKRAVQAIQSASVQTKYPYVYAGRYNTAIYIGSRHKPAQYRSINTETARKPRLKNRRGLSSGNVASIPGVVKGPRAHPPKEDKLWAEKINQKEKQKATSSAIAATADIEIVKKRGHLVPANMSFPVIVESKFEGISKTIEVKKALATLGLWGDVVKAKSKRQIRAGKGKKRGRKYKQRKSILIVAANSEKIFRAARNIAGVDVVNAKNLNADILAPGAVAGRLTVWTEGAIKALAEAK